MINSIPAHAKCRGATRNESFLERVDRFKHFNDTVFDSCTGLEHCMVRRRFATLFAILVHCHRGADSSTIHTILECCKIRLTAARGVAQVK